MIYELLGSDKIFNTTKNELRSYLSDIDRDRLDPRDRNYVVAMHHRIIIEQGDHEPRREHVEETPAQEKELSTAEWKDRAYKTDQPPSSGPGGMLVQGLSCPLRSGPP
jgi:hypothetical protein